MNLLLFSDLHSDFFSASKLVELSPMVDVVEGAGDFCMARRGLNQIIAALSAIQKPAVLVPGNAESHAELAQACRSWPSAHVLYGSQAILDDVTYYGIGGGIPITPFGAWSYDFSEDKAKEFRISEFRFDPESEIEGPDFVLLFFYLKSNSYMYKPLAPPCALIS